MHLIKQHIFYLAAYGVLLFSACTSEQRDASREARALTPTAGFGAGSQSYGENFKEGDVVWAWADRYGTHDGYIKAWKLTSTGVDGKFESIFKKMWPRDNSDLTIQAVHGDFDNELVEGVTTLSSLTHTISTEQSEEESRNRSDLLYASLSPANYKSQLLFFHMLSKIKIILKDTEGLNEVEGVTEANLANASMRLNNIATTVKLDVNANKAISASPYADINLGTTTADVLTAEAIIPPQVINAKEPFFELTLHDFPQKDSTRVFHFIAPNEGITFEPGKEYTYTLSVKNLIRVKPVDIPVWGWENIESTLVWSRFFFSVLVMEWNGLREYEYQWAWMNFLPTVEEWNGDEHFHSWAWVRFTPQVGDWNESEKEFHIPKNE